MAAPLPDPERTMMPVLELDDVHKSYRSHLSIRKYWILRGLSLSIREGEIFGYIGTNGAGKTTTIKLALGLIFPDAGDRKSTRLNSSHSQISYAVFCLKKKKNIQK